MNLFKSKSAKVIAGIVGLAMVLTFVAVPNVGNAQTLEELQAQINLLLQQIAQLQGQTSPSGFTFTRDLTLGSTGDDVMQLQKFLNSKGFMVAATGAGSPGQESSYFGQLTKSALASYQASQGISPAVGYFGPITRANINSMGGSTPPPGSGNCPTGYVEVTLQPAGFRCDPVSSGGVGSDGVLITSTLSLESTPADGTDLKPGNTNKAIAKWKIKTSGSDGKMIQFGIKATHRPWLYWSSARLVDGNGAVIAEKTNLTESDFNEATSGSDYRLVFGGLSHNLPKGVDNYVTLEVSSPLNTGRSATTGLVVTQTSNSVIVQDANDPSYTVSDGVTSNRTYDFVAATSGNIVPSLSSSSPKSQWVKVSSSGTTDGVELMSFNLKAEQRDVKIETLRFTITTYEGDATVGAPLATTLFSSIDLYDGSNLVGSGSVGSTTSFTDLSINIPENSIKTLTLKAKVADSDDFTLGDGASTTLAAVVTTGSTVSGIAGIDENSDALTVSGSNVTSNNTYFTTAVANISGTTATVTPVPDTPDSATIQFKFTMSAEGGDIFVSKTVSTALATTSSAAANLTSGLTTVTADNTHPSDTSTYWVISPGTNRTFTYTGALDNSSGTSGIKNFEISTVYWDDDASGFTEFNTNFGLEALEINHFLST